MIMNTKSVQHSGYQTKIIDQPINMKTGIHTRVKSLIYVILHHRKMCHNKTCSIFGLFLYTLTDTRSLCCGSGRSIRQQFCRHCGQMYVLNSIRHICSESNPGVTFINIVFVCLYITSSHVHHYANFISRHWTLKMPVRYNSSSVWSER